MASPRWQAWRLVLLQAHRDWTSKTGDDMVSKQSTNTLLDTGQDDDYTTTNSVHGGPARVAYLLKGQKPFGIN